MDPWIWLVFAHFVGDFPLQGDYLTKNKGSNGWLMMAHSVIWAGCISAVLSACGKLSPAQFYFLFLGHAFIDSWRARFGKDQSWAFYLDQVLHLIQLAVVYWWSF